MQILRLPLIIVAEVLWRLRRLITSAQASRVRESQSPIERMGDVARINLSDSIIAEDRQWLTKMLVRVPYWRGGHEAFANLSMQLNEIASAYASAMAMQTLSNSKESTESSKLIIAKCYLRRGVAAQAVPILEELYSSNSMRIDIAEEYAAALVACEQYQKAAEIFAKIPADQLSAQGHAAKAFVCRH